MDAYARMTPSLLGLLRGGRGRRSRQLVTEGRMHASTETLAQFSAEVPTSAGRAIGADGLEAQPHMTPPVLPTFDVSAIPLNLFARVGDVWLIPSTHRAVIGAFLIQCVLLWLVSRIEPTLPSQHTRKPQRAFSPSLHV